MRVRHCPPHSRKSGWPQALPNASHIAISTAHIAITAARLWW